MTKYEILVNILDRICEESPESFSSYNIDEGNIELLNSARSKAFIHLFLKVKCGLASFIERHNLITDGSQDGGVDAYYIDQENKKILFIQSKFRTNQNNFENKKITANDLVKMELKRILGGEKEDSRGIEFSSKIKKFQCEWAKIGDQAHYKYHVIVLGNIENYSDEQIKKVIDNSNYEIFDFNKSYKELVFPLCMGTYYDPKEIKITIDLTNKEQSTLKQQISTNLGEFPIRVLFVPTKEIGRIVAKYKNSILKYNPRNFLSLSVSKVNQRIRESIIGDTANDFAIYNNGITIIADSFELTESTGTKNVGQAIMVNPQIINGGQTAYVLSKIYEEQKDNDYSIFTGKEVMLKAIILSNDTEINIDFIERISNATNQQTRVEEADRRSNDKIQILLEKNIFETFGFFYERKKGEFYHGLDKKYIDKDCIVNRYDLLKAYLAWLGDASNARRSGSETLFKEKRFKEIMKKTTDFHKMFLAYKLLKNIDKMSFERKNIFGQSIRYGKMAIISAIAILYGNKAFDFKNVDEFAGQAIEKVSSMWSGFVDYAIKNNKNSIYIIGGNLDFDLYYKGRTVNQDIKHFFMLQKE